MALWLCACLSGQAALASIIGKFTGLSMKQGQKYSMKIVKFFGMNIGSYSTSL